ncbi:MAG: ABC transporter permease [Lachnospiraceae bacterium]|nr:ABC transporter permease [Lachnospiraceae bacterium]
MADGRVISVGKQFQIQMNTYLKLLFRDKKGIIVSLLFPVLADVVIVWITGKNMFVDYEGTQPSVFVIVSAAIWAGLFNTAQTMVSIRKNIKRDIDSGLSLGPYVASRAIVQFFLCALQAIIMTAGFPIAAAVYGNDMLEYGLIFDGSVGAILEIFVSMLLLTYAADLMGLVLSSFIKKAETGSTLTPYILIAQLIFSGSLFEMEGVGKVFSWLMISRWGNESIGAICGLETLESRFMIDMSTATIDPDSIKIDPYTLAVDTSKVVIDTEDCAHLARETAGEMYGGSAGHLLLTWGILILFCIVFIVASRIALNGVKKDDRSSGV